LKNFKNKDHILMINEKVIDIDDFYIFHKSLMDGERYCSTCQKEMLFYCKECYKKNTKKINTYSNEINTKLIKKQTKINEEDEKDIIQNQLEENSDESLDNTVNEHEDKTKILINFIEKLDLRNRI